MKNKLKNNQPLQLILIGGAIFIIFVLLAYLLLGNFSLFGTRSEGEIKTDDHTQREPEQILDIIDLKDQMPYYGNSFTMVFDDSEGVFFAYIDPANEEVGTQALNTFLQQNGIPNKESFPGLEIVDYPLPTPQP